MNNKIIWIFGPSAAGKETFINYINDKPFELLERLGWRGVNLVICDESLNWVVQSEDDNNEEKRKGLYEVIKKCSNNNQNSAILIKGQDLDFGNNSLIRVKESLLNDEHVIIFLYTDFEVLYGRYKNKVWWNELLTREICKNCAVKQINLLIEHQNNGFQIKSLNSSDDKKYKDIIFPPSM
jgi:hypothetical protein